MTLVACVVSSGKAEPRVVAPVASIGEAILANIFIGRCQAREFNIATLEFLFLIFTHVALIK